jgi:hypothetical protein
LGIWEFGNDGVEFLEPETKDWCWVHSQQDNIQVALYLHPQIPEFSNSQISIHRIIVYIDIYLGHFSGADPDRGNMVVPVEIIRVEQSILFSKKGVFTRRQYGEKIAGRVRTDGLD